MWFNRFVFEEGPVDTLKLPAYAAARARRESFPKITHELDEIHGPLP